jgi:hypothetical protein
MIMDALALSSHTIPWNRSSSAGAHSLRTGIALADTSRFGDDVWRLETAVLQRHVASLTLRFAMAPPRYRLHAKQ